MNAITASNSYITYPKLEHFWSYAGKVIVISRSLLNAAALNIQIVAAAGADFPQKVKQVTTRMKLFSIVGVPFTVVDIRNTVQKIFKSMLLNDKEGIALGLLSGSILAADAFDSLTTFVNAALATLSLKTVEAFSTISLPLSYGMASLGIVSRTIRISKVFYLSRNLHNTTPADLRRVLESNLGTEKAKASLLHAAPSEAVSELEKLYKLLEAKSDLPLHEISEILDKVQGILRKKMLIDLLGILANLIIISALVLFTLKTGGALPFINLAIAFAIRIGALVFQDSKKTI